LNRPLQTVAAEARGFNVESRGRIEEDFIFSS
jgi:hypothetical protein